VLSSIAGKLNTTLGQYFLDNKETFEKAINTTLETMYKPLLDAGAEVSGTLSGKPASGYTINVKGLVDEILSQYALMSKDCHTNSATGKEEPYWYDTANTAYGTYTTDMTTWKTEFEAAQTAYSDAVNANDTLLTAEEESNIEFYDALFSSIAENGWIENNYVNDADYLNQMLQNNMYTITTVDRDSEYNEYENKFNWFNSYDTDIASNCSNIFSVTDSDRQQQATANYEYRKSIINRKETRIDQRIDDLTTEDSALSKMADGLKAVINKNIETNFSKMG
jgi:hypothetical protein